MTRINVKTTPISKRGTLIFDIEMDKFSNLYYASYDQKCIYVVKKFGFFEHYYQSDVFCELKYVDQSKVFSNILMLNQSRDLLFIRVDADKILVCEVGEEDLQGNSRKVGSNGHNSHA